MDSDEDISGQLLDLTADMAVESLKLLPQGVSVSSEHPAARNAQSKLRLFEKTALEYKNEKNNDSIKTLRKNIEAAFDKSK